MKRSYRFEDPEGNQGQSMRRPRGEGWLKMPREKGKRGAALVNTATFLLGLLGSGLVYVSFHAQYVFIFATKHASASSIIEAAALDAGMIIFSLLALGLARAGQNAKVDRALILACAIASSVMNYAASDAGSIRSVLVYVMPPVFLAVVTDRVIAGVRRHWTGDAETSAWSVLGKWAGVFTLYTLRLLVAAPSTLSGVRRMILAAAPVPEVAARTALFIPRAAAELPSADVPTPVKAEKAKPERPTQKPAAKHSAPKGEKPVTRTAQLADLYKAHPAYGDKSVASKTASELAEQVGMSAGGARTWIYNHLKELDAANLAPAEPIMAVNGHSLGEGESK